MFALVIMGKRASNYTSDFVNFEGKWLNTKKLVTEALEGIYSLFGLDFRDASGWRYQYFPAYVYAGGNGLAFAPAVHRQWA